MTTLITLESAETGWDIAITVDRIQTMEPWNGGQQTKIRMDSGRVFVVNDTLREIAEALAQVRAASAESKALMAYQEAMLAQTKATEQAVRALRANGDLLDSVNANTVTEHWPKPNEMLLQERRRWMAAELALGVEKSESGIKETMDWLIKECQERDGERELIESGEGLPINAIDESTDPPLA